VTTQEIFTHPIAIGFYLGSIFTIITAYNYLRLKGEMSRFRRHLSDKLEIEAETMKKVKNEQETLRKENESLRVKVNALNEVPDRKAQRDLEVYARAEKRMLISVPGFAPAWETAKSEAHSELVEEESERALRSGSSHVSLAERLQPWLCKIAMNPDATRKRWRTVNAPATAFRPSVCRTTARA
jgi:hypothetical protein